jgi:hypothetical protein
MLSEVISMTTQQADLLAGFLFGLGFGMIIGSELL